MHAKHATLPPSFPASLVRSLTAPLLLLPAVPAQALTAPWDMAWSNATGDGMANLCAGFSADLLLLLAALALGVVCLTYGKSVWRI